MAIVAAGLALLMGSAAYASPFDEPPPSTAAPSASASAPGGAVSAVLSAFNHVQRTAALLLTNETTQLKTHSTVLALAIAVAMAFAYGCVHAAGPGHGKSVIVGYLVSRNDGPARALALSLWMALTHIASSLIVVLVVAVVLGRPTPSPEDDRLVRLISYGSIALLGIVLLVQMVRSRGEHDGCGHHLDVRDGRDRTAAALAVISGAVPCTGSLLVLTYAIANGIYLAGLVMICAIGLGMALTTTVLGLAAVRMRQRMHGTPEHSRPTFARFVPRLNIIGPLAIIGTALTMFWVTLRAT